MDDHPAAICGSFGIGPPRLSWFQRDWFPSHYGSDLSRKIAGEVTCGVSGLVGVAPVLIHIARKFLLKLRIILNHLEDLVVFLRIQTGVLHSGYFL